MTGLRSQTETGTENANVFPYEKRLFTLIPKIPRSAVWEWSDLGLYS